RLRHEDRRRMHRRGRGKYGPGREARWSRRRRFPMNQAHHSEVCAIVRTAAKLEPVPGHIAGRPGRPTDQWLAFEVGPHRLAVELDRVALVARGRFDVRNPEEAPRCCRDFTSLAPPAPLAFARLLFDVAPPIMLDDARLLLIVDDTRRFGLV